MNALDVAKPVMSSIADGLTYSFGINQKKVAEQLRRLADALDGDEPSALLIDTRELPPPFVLVEKLTVESTASRDDFAITKITFTIAEKVKAPIEASGS